MNIEALRTSFQSLDHGNFGFTRRFYETLFSRHPDLRSLFKGDLGHKQHAMLYQAFAAIMDHLDDAFWLKDALAKYGARHASYGVTSDMYQWFGECLLVTLAQAKGDEWTPALESAWREAYGAIASMMLAGAAAVSK